MTNTAKFFLSKTSARPTLRALALTAVLPVIMAAPNAIAQAQPVLAAHTPQTVSQTDEQTSVENAQELTDDRFKPRVYGAEPTPAPEPTPEPTPRPQLEPVTPEKAEQQANIIVEKTGPVIQATSDEPTLPESKWTKGISDQFVETIASVPIMEDPDVCEAGNPSLRIQVINVKKTEGIIVADLHDDVKENFLVWDRVVLRVRATAQKGETFFCMPIPKAGDYSVAIYHDKNGNKEFDKNFLGLPKERFGMSQNPKFGTKAPKYEEATFSVPDTGADILIKLRRTSDILSGKQD